ncbi:MerR family transcriptional regulator [Pedococcus ginsenosidimutans]|uniref:MerR family transcriptional regulator n=1 Tax=Pedococcus ginsenosidimutans TaxID=490570 RepID=A0ABP8Y0H7_9MICO
MRISELAETTGVPVHTLKYYLREGLLMPGVATSRTRAEYGEEHVERVRLVRALVEHGGVGISGVHSILSALAAPPPSRHELLGVAHCALPTPGDQGPVSEEVAALVADLGWPVWDRAPAVRALSAAVTAARDAGIPLPPETLRRYAEAMADVASVDLDAALAAGDPAAAMHTVVVGTVMVDPVLVALRRLAQEAVSAGRG